MDRVGTLEIPFGGVWILSRVWLEIGWRLMDPQEPGRKSRLGAQFLPTPPGGTEGTAPCSPVSSLLFSPSGHLPLFLGQVHPADLQQEVHIPLVGGCPGLAPGSVLHGLHSRLELLQAHGPQGLLQRGRELAGRKQSEVEESWGMVVDGCLPG